MEIAHQIRIEEGLLNKIIASAVENERSTNSEFIYTLKKAYKAHPEQKESPKNFSVKNTANLFHGINKDTKLVDTGCSVRLFNVLTSKSWELGPAITPETTVKELSKISMSEFKKLKGVGNLTIREMEELLLCSQTGIRK